jgi:hypothetical protein
MGIDRIYGMSQLNQIKCIPSELNRNTELREVCLRLCDLPTIMKAGQWAPVKLSRILIEHLILTIILITVFPKSIEQAARHPLSCWTSYRLRGVNGRGSLTRCCIQNRMIRRWDLLLAGTPVAQFGEGLILETQFSGWNSSTGETEDRVWRRGRDD